MLASNNVLSYCYRNCTFAISLATMCVVIKLCVNDLGNDQQHKSSSLYSYIVYNGKLLTTVCAYR